MDGGIATDGETVREDGGTPRDGGIFDASPGRDGEVDAAVADAGGVLRTAIYDVIASDDDALQDPGGPMLLTHWWISLYSDEHWGALRFELSGWNPAATIHDAYLEVYVDSTDEDSPRLRVFAERSPDAARLASTNNDIGSRPRTRSAVPWNDDDMGASWQRSPSIAILLREVTSLPGWRSGSHFLVIFDTQPDPSGRTFEIRQWDHSGGSYAARLVIEYSE